MIKTIDGAAFSRMMLSAAAEIDLNKQKVNELNVFPVPDGDTGTNMSMTLSAASTELRKADGITLTKAADKTASALLRGARGNSGVILSLLFRGFSKSLKGKLEADGKDFAAALTAGVEAAYKAVMKPAEGTILTVSRLTADAARDLTEGGKLVDETIRTFILSLSPEQRVAFTDALFDILTCTDAGTLTDLKEGGLKTAAAMLKKYRTLDKPTRHALGSTLRLFMAAGAKTAASELNPVNLLLRHLPLQKLADDLDKP